MAASVSSGAGAGAGAGADKKQRLGESVGRLTSELDLMKRLLADYMDRGGLPGGEFVELVLIWRSCMATDDRLLSSSQLSSSQASSAFVWCVSRVLVVASRLGSGVFIQMRLQARHWKRKWKGMFGCHV